MARFMFLLIGEPDHHDRWEAASEEERQRVLDHYMAFASAVSQRGALVAGEALERPSGGFSVPRDAEPRLVADGPFAETAEQIVGFYLADLPSRAVAEEVAMLLPAEHSVEVRSCPDVGVTPR
jgi:hypothetical protein